MNWDDPIVAQTIQRTVIEKLKLAEDVDVEIEQGYLAERFTAHLITYVLAEKLLSDTQDVMWHVRVPATSWQMFKQEHEFSWWLGWLVRRRPVKEKMLHHTDTFTFDRYALFPHSSLSHPYLGEPYIFEQTNLPNPKERAKIQS